MWEGSCHGYVECRIFANNRSRNYQRKCFDTLLTAEGPNVSMGRPSDLPRVLVSEILVGVAFNALVFPYLIWRVGLQPPAALGGADGVVASLTKATVFAVSLMTVILTAVWRRKGIKGNVPPVGAAVLAWSRYAPRNIVGRALFFVLAALATLAPLGVAASAGFGLCPMTKLGFAAFNVCFGALIGTVVTPFVTLAAMAENQKVLTQG
jgi:hypothetical protein